MAEPSPELVGPLAGLRVLDLTRVVAGPYATGLLADLGARVVKVERPGRGDEIRLLPDQVRGLSLSFSDLNRGKESLTLDLRTPEGREVLLRLLPHFDVLTENFKAGTLDRWGLGWDVLHDRHPGLIYAAVSGFGSDGPLAGRASYDLIAQATSGLMWMTGEADDPPVKTGVNLADYVGGLFLAIGILAALRERERTGTGQRLDVSNQEALVTMLDSAPSWYQATGRTPTRVGSFHRTVAPFGIYEAKDGWIVVGAGNPAMFRRSLRAIDRESLLDDPAFRERARRGHHRDEVNALWAEFVAGHSRDEIEALCLEHGLAFGRVRRIEDLPADPQLRERGFFYEIAHPDGKGAIPTRGVPIRFGENPLRPDRPAPILGADSDAILREVGLGDRERAALARDGVT